MGFIYNMGKTDRPSTRVAFPKATREYGVVVTPPNGIILIGDDLKYTETYAKSAGDLTVVWRAVSAWESLDTMG